MYSLKVCLTSFVILQVLNQIYCINPMDIKNLLMNGVGNMFADGLQNHVEHIEGTHLPFTAALKDVRCNDVEVPQYGYSPRYEACINLTTTVADIEKLILNTDYLSNQYAFVFSAAMNTSSICLLNTDKVTSLICLLKAINTYGTVIGSLNNVLISLLLEETQLSDDIQKFYNSCFLPNSTVSLVGIAQHYGQAFCKKVSTVIDDKKNL